MPSPPTVAYKALSAALALSASSFLPVYLGLVGLLIVWQYAFALSKTELHPLFVSLFLPLPFDSAYAFSSV